MFSWLLIIQFIYGLIISILYTLAVIILLVNWKHFDKYFFKLFVFQYFCNMWMYWNYYITTRLPGATCSEGALSSWFFSMSKDSTFSFPLNILLFIHYQLGFIGLPNVLLLSFNRYTMIFMTKNYEQIWYYGTYLFIAVFSVLPLVFTFPLYTHGAYFEYNPTSDVFIPRTYADLSLIYNEILIWMIVITLLCTALNVACWLRISKHSQMARQRSDYRLFLMSFATFLIQCIVVALGILNKISVDLDPSKTQLWSQIGQVLSQFGNELLTLSPPILLIVFSSRIRKTVKLVFTKRSFKLLSIAPVQNVRISKTAASKTPNF